MEQLRQPNLSVTGTMGLCLVYARQVFAVPAKYATATLGWQNAKYRHTDALPNAAVPVWFSWVGTVDGVTKNWGHVAVYVPGKGVYTSPVRSTQSGHGVYSTVQTMATAIGGTYLGWSEDINDVRVVQPATGGSMAETINDDVSRQIGWHYMGRNGFDGKPNALQSRQADIFGQPLTNAKLSEFFLSAEARNWRDSRIHIVYAERDALRTTNGNLNVQINQLTKAAADKQVVIDGQVKTIADQQMLINGQKIEIAELSDQVAQLTAENVELKKQLAEGGAVVPPTPATDSVVITKDNVWTAFVNWVTRIFK